MRILLVEDAEDVADAVAHRFRKAGHAVDVAADAATARDFVSVQGFDLMILDHNLPDGTGIELLRELRRRDTPTPVLMLTARDAVEDRVAALDAGADDYLVKPFDLRELEARARALMRRPHDVAPPERRLGRLTIDAGGVVTCDGRDLGLTRREFRLLEILTADAGRVIEKQRILDRLFDLEESPSLNTVDVYVARLRKRLADTGVSVQNLRGFGFRVVLDD